VKLTPFQTVFLGIFVFFILGGVLAFSLYTGKSNSVGTVIIWGTVDGESMNNLIGSLNQQDRSFQEVSYEQKSPDTYVTDVINAMASGAGPDIILLPQDEIVNFSNKVDTIPYSTLSQSSYLSSYVEEGQMFLTSQGTIALPFMLDPLVMYYNRDLFATAGISQPPQYWDELLGEAPKLTMLDPSQNIKQSAVALGSWDNITNAKDILAALFLQAGDRIVSYGAQGAPSVTLGTSQSDSGSQASSALQFYTEFANPSKTSYSWNRSLPNSQDAFVGGTLAVYLGHASEYATIAARNPNLHFAVAMLPQIQGNSVHLTYGKLIGLAIPRTSANALGALTIAQKLTNQIGSLAVASAFGVPPARSDVPRDTSASAASTVFAQSALISAGWLDPNPAATDDIFKSMVESVVSNKSDPNSAIQDGAQALRALLGTQ
jgi:multiple sugar transport system substrate-binding protein